MAGWHHQFNGHEFEYTLGVGDEQGGLAYCSSKTSILQCSAFFMVQLSHPYMTTGKTTALTRWTFVGKVMSLLFNVLYIAPNAEVCIKTSSLPLPIGVRFLEPASLHWLLSAPLSLTVSNFIHQLPTVQFFIFAACCNLRLLKQLSEQIGSHIIISQGK